MTELNLTGEARNEFGKGAARRIRRAKQIPAVIYGHGVAPCTSSCRSAKPSAPSAAPTHC